MALIQSTLASGLLSIADAHPANETAAIAAFADEFNTYMLGSTVLGVFLVPAIGAAAKTAMIAAMGGLQTAGAAAIQAGVIAYWAALGVPAAWPPSIVPTTPPPSLATLAAALTSVFAANTSGDLDNVASTNAIAAVWHPLMLGGFATIIIPPSTPVAIL